MADFTNQATLSYRNTVTNSNVVTGNITQVLSATKRAIVGQYAANDTVTYVISIVNSGSTPFTGLTVTDDLGAYQDGINTRVPLTYVTNSLQYYRNGVWQSAIQPTNTNPLTIENVSVPANGTVMYLYSARVNQFAPLGTGSTITNNVSITGGGLSTPVTATETINTLNEALLTISKSICPPTVSENGELTYTFVIQNLGNTDAEVGDNVVVTDTFNPILNPITVTFNDAPWTSPTNYTYNSVTGEFETVAGQITVPAATYTRDPATGGFVTTPGVSVLTVTGTV